MNLSQIKINQNIKSNKLKINMQQININLPQTLHKNMIIMLLFFKVKMQLTMKINNLAIIPKNRIVKI